MAVPLLGVGAAVWKWLAAAGAWAVGTATSDGVKETLKWLALKALLYGLITITLPAVLLALLNTILVGAMNLLTTFAGGAAWSPTTVQLTGFGAWLGNITRLPEVFAIIMSGVVFRISTRWIPFLR
jgi:hypothetical protein